MKKSKKKKIQKKANTIGLEDYMKAIHKGNREAELETSPGWKAINKVHKSKKIYNRKAKQIVASEEV